MVRLEIHALNVDEPQRSKELLLAVEGDEWQVAATAWSWAKVRDHASLVKSIERTFAKPVPTSGVVAVIDRASGLLVFARWPKTM